MKNAFAIGCQKFSLSFTFSDNSVDTPILYSIDPETEKKSISEIKSDITSDANSTIITWAANNMVKGEILRLEW